MFLLLSSTLLAAWKACGVLSVSSGGNSVQWGGKEGVTAYNSIVTECLGSFQQTVCTASRSERAFGDVKHAVATCWIWFVCWKLRIKRITLKGVLIPQPGTVAISPEAHVCRINSSPRPLKLIWNMKEKFWNEQNLCWPSHVRGETRQWPCGWQSGSSIEVWVGASLVISIYSGSSCRRLDHWQGQCPIPDPCLVQFCLVIYPCFGKLKITALLSSVGLRVCKVPVLWSVSQPCLGHRAGIYGRVRDVCVSPSGHLHIFHVGSNGNRLVVLTNRVCTSCSCPYKILVQHCLERCSLQMLNVASIFPTSW